MSAARHKRSQYPLRAGYEVEPFAAEVRGWLRPEAHQLLAHLSCSAAQVARLRGQVPQFGRLQRWYEQLSAVLAKAAASLRDTSTALPGDRVLSPPKGARRVGPGESKRVRISQTHVRQRLSRRWALACHR